MYRVNEVGEFVEEVNDWVVGVVRLRECIRVDFLEVKREAENDEKQRSAEQVVWKTPYGRRPRPETSGANGSKQVTRYASVAEGRFHLGKAEE